MPGPRLTLPEGLQPRSGRGGQREKAGEHFSSKELWKSDSCGEEPEPEREQDPPGAP